MFILGTEGRWGQLLVKNCRNLFHFHNFPRSPTIRLLLSAYWTELCHLSNHSCQTKGERVCGWGWGEVWQWIFDIWKTYRRILRKHLSQHLPTFKIYPGGYGETKSWFFSPILLPKDFKHRKRQERKMEVVNSVKTREVIIRNVHKELYHLGPVFHIMLSKTHIFKVTGSLAFAQNKSQKCFSEEVWCSLSEDSWGF